MWPWSGSAPTTRPGRPGGRGERRTFELAVLRSAAPARLALSRPGGQPLRGGVDSGGTGPGPGLPKLPATTGRAVIVFRHDNCLSRIAGYPRDRAHGPADGVRDALVLRRAAIG
jgi:hypothetical protein